MSELGTFIGVGVGPGTAGYLSVAAYAALKQSDIIFVPRASHVNQSVAGQCLAGLDIPCERLRDIAYNMESDRTGLSQSYAKLAEIIAKELRDGLNVAYITIGDSLTYSTYSYTLAALVKILPAVRRRTFAGITSYAAVASALEWPLGQGKERTLILPCPDEMTALKKDIESHDIVVLMKIGHRLCSVLEVLDEMEISSYCAFASRIGLDGEVLSRNLNDLPDSNKLGYLTTMLIRKTNPEDRSHLEISNETATSEKFVSVNSTLTEAQS
jgi:precorrin-2/cobalt-factor-2 C20-methyltransferase